MAEFKEAFKLEGERKYKMAEKKKVEVITIDEFKEIFKLEGNYKVSKNVLKQYTNYIKGSYLLYQEFENIKSQKLFMYFHSKRIKLQAHFIPSGGFQNWIKSLGSQPMIEISYWHKNRDSFEPFWAQGSIFGRENTNVAIALAYETFTSNVLRRIESKYCGKYKVQMGFRNVGKGTYRGDYAHVSDMMKPIWLDGVSFMSDLEVLNPQGSYEYINSYTIRRSIDNRKDIWIQPLLPPVKRIIDSIADH